MGEREGRASSGRRARRQHHQQQEQAEPAPGGGADLWPPPAPTASAAATATIRTAAAPAHRRAELTRTLSMVEVCAVCLEEVRERRERVTRLPCSHKYHSDCVLPWLAIHPDCPCCRALVPSLDAIA